MNYLEKAKLNEIIKELSNFVHTDYSSRFRHLNPKEDRQLFFLAQILTKLKSLDNGFIERELTLVGSGKVIPFRKKTN